MTIKLNCGLGEASRKSGIKKTTLCMKLQEPETRFYCSDFGRLWAAGVLAEKSFEAYFPNIACELEEGTPLDRAGGWTELEKATGIPRSTYREKQAMEDIHGNLREWKLAELQSLSRAHLITKAEAQEYINKAWKARTQNKKTR